MSGITLERARQNHEDIEVYEKAIAAILDDKPKTHKGKVWQQHRVANLIERITGCAKDLEVIYKDKDGIMKEEISGLRGRDAFPNFYSKLEQAKEYHQKFPDLPVRHHPDVQQEAEPQVQFSGEEVFGKYLDLQALHTQYYSLPQTEKVDYNTYLDSFTVFTDIPHHKKNATYAAYVRALHDYLRSFLQRTQPLLDLNEIIGPKAEEKFESLWNEGKIPGWPKASEGGGGGTMNGGGTLRPVDLSKFYTAESLEALGMDRLKEGLMALGLKCGGTLKERAARLFLTKGKAIKDLDKKLLAKKVESNGTSAGGGHASSHSNNEQGKHVAEVESKVGLLGESLLDVIAATKRYVEKKQTHTLEEREAEWREEEEGVVPDLNEPAEEEEGSDDDEGPVYNPLNLPLGYDGKPIPYWLYKLHGLGHEFKCEICGNYSYWGRRAFDRHFQEWRHSHGMRCLGIPNTKHFHDITLIEDAQALYAKIKDQVKAEVYDADQEEEFEDSEGNVLNRRTFEDLARQGLL